MKFEEIINDKLMVGTAPFEVLNRIMSETYAQNHKQIEMKFIKSPNLCVTPTTANVTKTKINDMKMTRNYFSIRWWNMNSKFS